MTNANSWTVHSTFKNVYRTLTSSVLSFTKTTEKKANELTCRALRIYKVFQIFNFFMDFDPNKCEFCYAFFADASKESEHNRKCEFRLSRTFVASDGNVKFACTVSGGATVFSFLVTKSKLNSFKLQVCRDVFAIDSELKSHESMHKYPGGYACSVCNETFRNDSACIRHEATIHQVRLIFSAFNIGKSLKSLCVAI